MIATPINTRHPGPSVAASLVATLTHSRFCSLSLGRAISPLACCTLSERTKRESEPAALLHWLASLARFWWLAQ